MIKTIGIALTVSAGVLSAGDFYEGVAAPSSAPVANSFGGSNLFIGGGVEYFMDEEQEFYSGHIGYDFGNNSSIYLEAGWMGEDSQGVDIDVVPVTLNYKYEAPLTSGLNFYIGAGAGVAFIEAEGFGASLDDQVFAAQAFVGLLYNVSETFEIYGGARYVWTDDVDFGRASIDGFDDVSLGGGIRINF